MTERDVLYREILARPEDDFPRRVFADHLADHGEQLRAAFIQQQLDDPTRDADVGSVPSRGPFFDGVPEILEKGFTQVKFRRGFVDWVAAPLEVLLREGRWLVDNHPVTQVSATDKSIPTKEGHYSGWWSVQGYASKIEIQPDDLPHHLWLALTPQPWEQNKHWKIYDSDAKATDDLSRAILSLFPRPSATIVPQQAR